MQSAEGYSGGLSNPSVMLLECMTIRLLFMKRNDGGSMSDIFVWQEKWCNDIILRGIICVAAIMVECENNMSDSVKNAKKDITVILSISIISAALYLTLEGTIMDYGRDLSHPLFLRFLPVLLIQFGMSCLGVLIVLLKNKERLPAYGLVWKHIWQSLIGCLLVSIPTVAFLFVTNDVHGFLPFQGMFLTKEILGAPLPFNVTGYLVIALTWGFGEGLFYIVLADKINLLCRAHRFFNVGAFICAVIAIAIHGMIGFDLVTLLEAFATFILMYGSLVIRQRTGNAWGNILIFFVVWNAL